MADVLDEAKLALLKRDTEKIVACYGEPFVFEDTAAQQRITDRSELRTYFQRLFAAPGPGFTNVVILRGDKWAAAEWTWTRRKPDTHEELTIKGASIFELSGGRIRRETVYHASSSTVGAQTKK